MKTTDEKKWQRFVPILFLVLVFPIPEAIVWLLTGTNPLSSYLAVGGMEYVFILVMAVSMLLFGITSYIRLRFF